MASKKYAHEEIIEIAKSKIVLEQPFYACILLNLIIEPDDGNKLPPWCAGMGTDGRHIWYTPTQVEKWGLSSTMGVLIHEANHLLYLHHLRRGWREQRPWNIACDKPINALITKAGYTLPKEGIIDVKYEDKCAEELYEESKQELDKNTICIDVNFGGVLDHPDIGDPAGAPHAEKEMKMKIAQAAQIAKMMGKIPIGMERFIEEILESKLPWKELLRRFMMSHSKDDYSWRKPNKRFISQSTYLPSLYNESLGEMILGIDTSGSISEKELSLFLGEFNKIIEDVKPSKIWVICCDCEVPKEGVTEVTPDMYPISSSAFSKMIKGGGGTAFTPVFKKVDELQITPTCLVYMTDLCGSDFGTQPDYPVLWITTQSIEAPWGEVVKLDDK